MLAAASALVLGWGLSNFAYFTVVQSGFIWGNVAVDGALAVYFWTLSRNRWFPVPLFYVQVVTLCYYLYVAVLNLNTWFWIAAFINRLFDLELLYVAACAIYRIRALKRPRKPSTNGRTAV